MKKIQILFIVFLFAVPAFAVPAHPGWNTFYTSEGDKVLLQQQGDEFGHWLVDNSGNIYEQDDNDIVHRSASTLGALQLKRQAQKNARLSRPHKMGNTPNIAPRGLVILANYSDHSFQAACHFAGCTEVCSVGGRSDNGCGTRCFCCDYAILVNRCDSCIA